MADDTLLEQLNVNDEYDICVDWLNMNELKMKIKGKHVKVKIVKMYAQFIMGQYMGSDLRIQKCTMGTNHCHDKNVSPLNTFTIKYDKLEALDAKNCYCPVYYDDNYIIFTSSEYYKLIYKYDISKDTVTQLASYANIITDIEGNTHQLDTCNTGLALKNNNLLIMDTDVFAEFNLKTLEWKVIENGGICNVYGGITNTSYHTAIFIDNKLHLIAHEMHGVFDENTQQFIGLNHYQKLLFAPYWLVYVPKMKLLFAFSDESNDIVYCKMDNKDIDYWYEWKIYGKLPNKNISGCFLAFDHIIFLLFCNQMEIWCIDILYNKTYKCVKEYPFDSLDVCCFDSKNKFIHFYDGGWGENHIKVNLYDIVPNELKQFYDIKYIILTMGYAKQCHIKSIVPDVIFKLIVAYFFVFNRSNA
eukprot:751_1